MEELEVDMEKWEADIEWKVDMEGWEAEIPPAGSCLGQLFDARDRHKLSIQPSFC